MINVESGKKLAAAILEGMGVEAGDVHILDADLLMPVDGIATLEVSVPFNRQATDALVEAIKERGLTVVVRQMPPPIQSMSWTGPDVLPAEVTIRSMGLPAEDFIGCRAQGGKVTAARYADGPPPGPTWKGDLVDGDRYVVLTIEYPNDLKGAIDRDLAIEMRQTMEPIWAERERQILEGDGGGAEMVGVLHVLERTPLKATGRHGK